MSDNISDEMEYRGAHIAVESLSKKNKPLENVEEIDINSQTSGSTSELSEDSLSSSDRGDNSPKNKFLRAQTFKSQKRGP